jgi:hypothetical protein
MKRFGYYDNDFNKLFECYERVTGDLVTENLPSELRELKQSQNSGTSYPGLDMVKVFHQKRGRGADLIHQIDVSKIESDNGEGGVILSGSDGDKTFDIITNNKNAQVKVYDPTGKLENQFVTSISPRYDTRTNELTIINIDVL